VREGGNWREEAKWSQEVRNLQGDSRRTSVPLEEDQKKAIGGNLNEKRSSVRRWKGSELTGP